MLPASHLIIHKTLHLRPTQASWAFPGANLTAGTAQTSSAHTREAGMRALTEVGYQT